jgi:hypothetical protein
MKELSLHILDIVQNSIVANATLIEIKIDEDSAANTLSIEIVDNGKGMPQEVLQAVLDPYTTSRTTRKVGMGLPLLNDACKMAGGKLVVESEIGKGTLVAANFILNHIDRQPIGDMAGIVVLLVSANPNIDFIYSHSKDGNVYKFDTKEVKEALDGIPLNSPEVRKLLREIILSNLEEL